jgi:hypothetical protein
MDAPQTHLLWPIEQMHLPQEGLPRLESAQRRLWNLISREPPFFGG